MTMKRTFSCSRLSRSLTQSPEHESVEGITLKVQLLAAEKRIKQITNGEDCQVFASRNLMSTLMGTENFDEMDKVISDEIFIRFRASVFNLDPAAEEAPFIMIPRPSGFFLKTTGVCEDDSFSIFSLMVNGGIITLSTFEKDAKHLICDEEEGFVHFEEKYNDHNALKYSIDYNYTDDLFFGNRVMWLTIQEFPTSHILNGCVAFMYNVLESSMIRVLDKDKTARSAHRGTRNPGYTPANRKDYHDSD